MSDAICENKQSSDTIFGAAIHAVAHYSLVGLLLDDQKHCAGDKTVDNQPAQAKDLQTDVTVPAQPDQTDVTSEAQPDSKYGKTDTPHIYTRGAAFEPNAGNAVLSDQERNQAVERLEKGISKLIPEADRQTMGSMIASLAKGDEKSFAEALKQNAGNPEKMKKIADEINRLMEEKGGDVRMYTTADGKVVVCNGISTAVPSFDPASGKAEVKEIEHNLDGTIQVKPGEVLNGDVHNAFSNIGDGAVTSTNNEQGSRVRLEAFDNALRLQLYGSAVAPYGPQPHFTAPHHHQ